MTHEVGERRSINAEPFEPAGVDWSSVSPRLATARRVSTGVVFLVPAVVATAFGFASDATWLVVVAAVLVALTLWSWWLIGRQTRDIGYAERNDELLVRRGIAWRQIVVVPYARLQYVEVGAGPLDRLCRIARVQLHTASASTDASIPGLPPDEAARLRDRLTSRGQSQLAGL